MIYLTSDLDVVYSLHQVRYAVRITYENFSSFKAKIQAEIISLCAEIKGMPLPPLELISDEVIFTDCDVFAHYCGTKDLSKVQETLGHPLRFTIQEVKEFQNA